MPRATRHSLGNGSPRVGVQWPRRSAAVRGWLLGFRDTRHSCLVASRSALAQPLASHQARTAISHSGYRPQLGMSSGGYSSAFQTTLRMSSPRPLKARASGLCFWCENRWTFHRSRWRCRSRRGVPRSGIDQAETGSKKKPVNDSSFSPYFPDGSVGSVWRLRLFPGFFPGQGRPWAVGYRRCAAPARRCSYDNL